MRELMAYTEADVRKRGTRTFYERTGSVMELCLRDFYKPGDDRLTYVKRVFL